MSSDESTVTTYTYDSANRLLVSGSAGRLVSYTWDERGNLVSDGTFTYAYDAAGRMVQAESVTVTLVYTYNAQGLRVAQSVNGTETPFVWDWASGLPEMLSDGNDLYLVGHDTLGQWDGATWDYYLPDGLGSIRQKTDAAGTVTSSREWTPFGVEVGTVQAGLGYTGEWKDTSVDLQYLRARWFDSQMGRFTQKDPWNGNHQRPQTLHPYAYVVNNAINFVDPSGLCLSGDPECEALGRLAPVITENARKFNQRIFTNMTDQGFAAMLGAKILYEGELPGGGMHTPLFEGSPEWLSKYNVEGLADWASQCYAIEKIISFILDRGKDPIFQGTSFGIANVYFAQATQSAWWWQDLVAHQEVYGLDLQESWLETRYYEVWELEDQWYRQPVVPGTQPVPSPWNSRATLIDELRTVKGAIQFQALGMLHQGWKIYEGAPENWGENEGTPTSEVSAFRIAMGVFSNATDPSTWRLESTGLGMSENWVGLIPRAADCLGLSAIPGSDYLPLSTEDRERFTKLGHTSNLP